MFLSAIIVITRLELFPIAKITNFILLAAKFLIFDINT
ncbi:hypothetical protein MWLp12_1703 [Lactiplantibacillus plantarum]|nr:hypothetical protein Nizo2802_2117 [Lactiplantibacillus plantarum]KZU90969.1 hypothetical protein Nizo3893_2031 [Lactiplantibacillus plantarum]WCL69091.1 hypothetical protein MWLp12_1703 [Lactiplantibacillus plantarum]